MNSKPSKEGKIRANKPLKTKKYHYISALYCLSAFAVVMLHANGGYWNYRPGHAWAISNFIECGFYFAVPIFFMLTGATLFDYSDRYDTRTFFKRRLSKILVPLIFWSIFGMVFYGLVRKERDVSGLGDVINAVIAQRYVDVFWFFRPLICIYLATPLFAFINKEKKLDIMTYVAAVGLVINVLIPFIVKTLNIAFSLELKFPFDFGVVSNGLDYEAVSSYLLFSVIGYVLHKRKLSTKHRFVIYIIGGISALALIVGTYMTSRLTGRISGFFKEYDGLPCTLYSISVFVAIKYFFEEKRYRQISKYLVRPILYLQKYTFAVYLIHAFVMRIIADILEQKANIQMIDVAYVPLSAIFTMLSCWLITNIVRKVPFGKWLLP